MDIKIKDANVHNLIALCHILDDYNTFSENLSELIEVKYNRDIILNLVKISNGENVLGSIKVKKFYHDNKQVIDTINKFSSIGNFINYSYDFKGNLNLECGLDFFYNYFKSHKDKLDRIILVLEKIEKLGISSLQFDEEINFTCNQYELHTCFSSNFKISYLDNIEIVPNYLRNFVEYRTTGSNYEIVVETFHDEITKYGRKIIVNSLLFDPKKLPDDITKEIIFDKIIDLKNNQKNVCSAIKNSVDLSIGVYDLLSQFNSSSQIIERLNNVDNKEELHKVLLGIKLYLEQLQSISARYDDSVLQNNKSITKEKLEEEKRLYLERREWSKIDLD